MKRRLARSCGLSQTVEVNEWKIADITRGHGYTFVTRKMREVSLGLKETSQRRQ